MYDILPGSSQSKSNLNVIVQIEILTCLVEQRGYCRVNGCRGCVIKAFEHMNNCVVIKAYELAKWLIEENVFEDINLETTGVCVTIWNE